jgi:aminoglycoside phosphotransferase (APT) family kinase protein
LLIDWNQAHVDHPWLDLAILPRHVTGLTERQHRIARQAWCASAVATNWRIDPDFAQKRLRELYRLL